MQRLFIMLKIRLVFWKLKRSLQCAHFIINLDIFINPIILINFSNTNTCIIENKKSLNEQI